MTPEQFRVARNILRLTQNELAALLDATPQTNHLADYRLAQIEAQRAQAAECPRTATKYQGVGDVVENAEENRLQIIFDDKPTAEVRSTLKSHGFRWAPSHVAWQRQLNNSARFAVKCVLRECGVAVV